MKNKRLVFEIAVLLFYMFTVLWFTVISRSEGLRGAHFDLFWSYRAWFAGNNELGIKIVANMAMFMPLGFLLAGLFSHAENGGKKFIFLIPAAGAGFSLCIEVLQLMLLRGVFEWDDMVSNTVGALLGLIFYLMCTKVLGSRKEMIGSLIHIVFVAVCVFIFIRKPGEGIEGDIDATKVYCIEVEEVSFDEAFGEMSLEGFAFFYDEPDKPYELWLKSTETGRRAALTAERGLPRPDVNAYFLCECDYTNVGFTAAAPAGATDKGTEYEVLIKWPFMKPVGTGIYVRDGGVFYAPENADLPDPGEGEHLRNILEKGILLVARPDMHCWVYQMGRCLYWVVDEGFQFEEDGTTYIQYQLTTTQYENLPEKRLAHGWYWDNIGGYFETYELEGDFGSYRVSRRELPAEYSIKSIVTGYYKNGKWQWKSYFRPVYGI